MEKLEIKRNEDEFYYLEVNDNGDYIAFDLTDINLPEKIMKASDNIKNINEEYLKEMADIEKELVNDKEKLIREVIKIEKNKCLKMRDEFDSFLGLGACQKIFGDKNNYGMFSQLFEALEPHFNKMKINLEKAKKKLVDQYLPKNKDVM